MKTGALIIASLNLDRENKDNEEMSTFIPMLHLDGTSIIKREIVTLRRAGITPIMVLGGYQKGVLKNHLSHNGVLFFEDDDYEKHSWMDSVQLGVKKAMDVCDRILVIPVETPAFSTDTIVKLAECDKNTIPVFKGKESRIHVVNTNEPYEEQEHMSVEDEGVCLSVLDKNGTESLQQYVKELRDANDLRLGIRLTLSKETEFFGPDTFDLLKLIGETGSIRAAATKMGISYSKGWKMINKMEEEMGFHFLNRCNGGKDGGSSTLTEEGIEFINKYHAMMDDVERMAGNFFDVYFADFQ